MIEIVILNLPYLATVTFLESFSYFIPFIIGGVIIILMIHNHPSSKNLCKYNEILFSDQSAEPKSQILKNTFTATIVIVSICILAVDFSLFPNRHLKTKTYGCSLMDSGVSVFVALNAVISPQARQNYVKDKLKLIKKSFFSSTFLIFCGFVRVFLLRTTDYHQEITEYGLDWNFFFTLAFTKVRQITERVE